MHENQIQEKQTKPPSRAINLSQVVEELKEYIQHNPNLKIIEPPYEKLQLLMNHSYSLETTKLIEKYCEKHSIKMSRKRISHLHQQKNLRNPREFMQIVTDSNKQPLCKYMRPLPADFNKTLQAITQLFGYIPSLQTLLMSFPTYLKYFTELNLLITESDNSPIEHVETYIIAIMAVSCYGSIYMIRRLIQRFKEIGGDTKWLKGELPSKIKALRKLNAFLAFQPWAIDQSLFKQVIQNTKYNIHQITYIMVLMSFYHSITCVCLSNGLIVEESIQSLEKYIDIKSLEHLPHWKSSCKVEERPYKSEKVFSLLEVAEQFQSNKSKYELEQISFQNKKFSKMGSEQYFSSPGMNSLYMKQIDKQIKSYSIFSKITEAFANFIDKEYKVERYDTAKFIYLEYSIFNFQYGTFLFIDELNSKLANAVSNLIEYTKTMTTNSIGNKSQSTKTLRKAIRFYYQNLSGYRHQDFNYRKNMTDFLSKEIKFYIKIVTYYPFLMQNSVLQNMPHQGCNLSFFDTLHICLLAINTKFELALTMSTRILKKMV